ncbi:hypothetical protein FOZ62_017581, partial [Perkinsus olseni]
MYRTLRESWEPSCLVEVPITALTATATPGIAQDVQAQLRMAETVFIKGGINRANLSYRVMKKSRSKVMNDILRLIKLMDTEVQGKASGIVYCVLRSARRWAADRVHTGTKAECETIAEGLRKLGISAGFYHG